MAEGLPCSAPLPLPAQPGPRPRPGARLAAAARGEVAGAGRAEALPAGGTWLQRSLAACWATPLRTLAPGERAATPAALAGSGTAVAALELGRGR